MHSTGDHKTHQRGFELTKSFLSVADVSEQELTALLDRTGQLKSLLHKGTVNELNILRNKIVGLLFEKPSTRTRTGFEVAVDRLGGKVIYLASSETQLSRGEPVKDTARILGSYLDCIVARVYSQGSLEELSKYSSVPIINALSDLEHPTQAVCDLFTMMEVKGKLEGLKLAYIGDGNNVCNSLLLGAAMVGMHISVACPTGYDPDRTILSKAEEIASNTQAKLSILRKPADAAEKADVLYTDVWVSMGEEAERQKRLQAFQGYQINSDLLKAANEGAIVMHCLPAHRGLEITDDVIEGTQSVVWRQGENKFYAAASTLELCCK